MRTSVAPPVCHQRCCHDHYQDDHGGGRGVRPWPSGRADLAGPFELADAVLAETRTREQRLRDLPSRVGIYFTLALGLFPGLGYGGVWQKLTASLDGFGLPSPSPKALRDLRRRIGAAPLKALFEVLAGPAAQPSTPGVTFGRYRTVAFDGCTSIKVPDTARNRGWLGKMKAALGVTGYPAVELMTLVETGTRAQRARVRSRARSRRTP